MQIGMQKKWCHLGILGMFTLVCIFSGAPAWSKTVAVQRSPASASDSFDYPELTVVPRASDRLQMEAKDEENRKWTYLPIQISALATTVAGAMSWDSTNSGYSVVGLSIGGIWLAGTVYLMTSYHPYTSSWSTISELPKGTTREQLTRERLAEEEINSIGAAGQRLKWISFITNLGASVFMMTKGTPSNSNGTNYPQLGASITSAVLSFTPLIFGSHWSDVSSEQRDYKKRIYGPIAQPTFFMDEKTKELVPGAAVSLQF